MKLEEAIAASKRREDLFLQWQPIARKFLAQSDYRGLEAHCKQEIGNRTEFASRAAFELTMLYSYFGDELWCGSEEGERQADYYRWIRVKLGDPTGYYWLAEGKLDSNFPETVSEAIGYLQKGAAGGCSLCKHTLGVLYRDGDKVLQNLPKAEKLLLEAATIDAGSIPGASKAMLDIALFYDDGLLGTPNVKKAERWYNEFIQRVRAQHFQSVSSDEEKQASEQTLFQELRQALPGDITGRQALQVLLASLTQEEASRCLAA